MGTPNMTRQSVEQAEPLSFPTKRSAVVRMAFRGVPVDVSLGDANVAEVERLVASLLERDGWSGAAVSSTSASAPTKAQPQRGPMPEPWYNDAGETCCPWHKRPLREGQHGLYCPSKAEGDQAGPKGYCRFSVKD